MAAITGYEAKPLASNWYIHRKSSTKTPLSCNNYWLSFIQHLQEPRTPYPSPETLATLLCFRVRVRQSCVWLLRCCLGWSQPTTDSISRTSWTSVSKSETGSSNAFPLVVAVMFLSEVLILIQFKQLIMCLAIWGFVFKIWLWCTIYTAMWRILRKYEGVALHAKWGGVAVCGRRADW